MRPYLNKKSKQKKKYPRTKVPGGKHEDRICVAFVYLPGGMQVFEGRRKYLLEHLSTYPTSHGSLISYLLGNRFGYMGGKKIVSREWFIFGKNSEKYRFRKSRRNDRRKVIQLFFNDDLIEEWRKLPKKHLRQFKRKSRYALMGSN